MAKQVFHRTVCSGDRPAAWVCAGGENLVLLLHCPLHLGSGASPEDKARACRDSFVSAQVLYYLTWAVGTNWCRYLKRWSAKKNRRKDRVQESSHTLSFPPVQGQLIVETCTEALLQWQTAFRPPGKPHQGCLLGGVTQDWLVTVFRSTWANCWFVWSDYFW